MALIYDESSVHTGGQISIAKINSTKAYLRHYENKLVLSFFAKAGNQTERWQAEKELVICERKMRFWEKHPNFIGEEARKGMESLNRNWRMGGA